MVWTTYSHPSRCVDTVDTVRTDTKVRFRLMIGITHGKTIHGTVPPVIAKSLLALPHCLSENVFPAAQVVQLSPTVVPGPAGLAGFAHY